MAVLRGKTATGIYLGESELVTTTIALTPMGVRELHSETHALDELGVADCLADLVARKQLPGQVVCGVDARRFFLVTQAPPHLEEDQDLAEVLAGRLTHVKGGIVSGSAPCKLPSGQMITFVAGPGQVAREALSGLQGISQKRLLLTGVPLALFEMARKLRRSSRRLATELRVFLGERQALAVLAHAGNPVALHMFDCPPLDRVRAIEMATINLVARARATLSLRGVDVVYLHAGDAFTNVCSQCETASGVPFVAAPEISLTAGSASQALARIGLKRPKAVSNLFQRVFAEGGFLKNLPVGVVLMLAGLLAGIAVTFSDATATLEAKAEALKEAAKADYKSVGVKKADLDKRHGALKDEFKLSNYFITDRIFWGEVLAELPDIVPTTMTVEDFDGRDKVLFPRKKKAAATVVAKIRQMTIAGVSPVEEGVKVPPELYEFSAAIQNSPVIHGPLPRITNSNVRLMPGVDKTMARILITSAP